MPVKLQLSKDDIATTETPEKTAAAMHYVSRKVLFPSNLLPHKVHIILLLQGPLLEFLPSFWHFIKEISNKYNEVTSYMLFFRILVKIQMQRSLFQDITLR